MDIDELRTQVGTHVLKDKDTKLLKTGLAYGKQVDEWKQLPKQRRIYVKNAKDDFESVIGGINKNKKLKRKRKINKINNKMQ